MSSEHILYDRIWLQEYIEHISYEKQLTCELYDTLQTELYRVSGEKRNSYIRAMDHTRNLIESLDATKQVLQHYLEHVQEAAVQLKRKCLETEIPEFLR